MKSTMEIVMNSPMTPNFKSNQERTSIYREAFEAARGKLSDQEQEEIDLLTDHLANARIRSFGARGALELLGALGIWLLQIPDKQLESLVKARRQTS